MNEVIMKNYKIITLFISLSFLFNLHSMEKKRNRNTCEHEIEQKHQEGESVANITDLVDISCDMNLGSFGIIPNEIRYNVISLILENNINNWDDIFNFDKASLKDELDRVQLISKYFNVFKKEELKNLVMRLETERFEVLKAKIKNQYKDFSKEELHQKLNPYLQLYFPVPQEKLQEAIKLIIAGADDINIKRNIDSIFRFASASGYIEIVRLLMKYGTDINGKSGKGLTALFWAAREGEIEIVSLLIKNGAELDITDVNNMTPLMVSARYGHREVARLLMKKGAKIDIKNIDGNTALKLSSKYGHKEVERLLKGNSWFCSCILQ